MKFKFQRATDSYEMLEMSSEEAPVRTASTSRARVELEDHWMASSTLLSPLEKFYHRYIAQYDLREDVPVNKRAKGRAEKKGKKKLSAVDNTISSMESLSCDENHQLKAASTQSEPIVKEPSKDGMAERSDTAIRELHNEGKFLLRKDWESSDQTSRSEPVHSYARPDDINYEQMDATYIANPAPEDEADLANEEQDNGAMFHDNILDEDRVFEYEPDHSNKPSGSHAKESQFSIMMDPGCIRIRDKTEQLCVDGKTSQIIILGDFKLSSSAQASYARRNKDSSYGSDIKRSPMRINGENVYINIGGENTQIKSYKDYGTVKISGRHSKKISEAAARMKKTKASMKPPFVNADVSNKHAKSRSRQYRETSNGAKKCIGGEQTENMQGRTRVDGNADSNSAQGYDVANASMGKWMSENLDEMNMVQMYSAIKDGERCIDIARGQEQNGASCSFVHPVPSIGMALREVMETLNYSAGQMECAVVEENCSVIITELAREDSLSDEAAASKTGEENPDCPPSNMHTSNGVHDLTRDQDLPGTEDLRRAQQDTSSNMSAAAPPVEELNASDETGLVDIYSLGKEINGQNHQLKKCMSKFREKTEKIARLYKYMEQLQLETAEMKRLLAGVDRETEALRCEAAEMRCTVTAICDLSVATIGKDTEARRLEPACYRRYLNIRTAADASAALTAVRNRIKALSELEVLIYRKQLVLHHVLPTLTQEKAPPPKRVNRPAHKGNKSKKNEESASNQTTTSGGGHIVIEVVSPAAEITTPSWSDEVSHTESPMTISAPLSGSNDGTVSTALPDTEV